MAAPIKPWQENHETQVLRSSNPMIPNSSISRSVPTLPPRPPTIGSSYTMGSQLHQNPYSSYGMGYGGSYGSMGYGGTYGSMGYGGSYGSMGYRSPMYNSYGSYGYGNGMYNSGYGPRDDAESRFVQFAEERSRDTFASVESVVRAINSISMMLDNTFFAMTSSFRAVLSVAENFGHLRNMFGQIWYSLSIFRLVRWLYRRLMKLMGYKVMNSGAASLAWTEAGGVAKPPGGNNWPTVAFFGLLISAPYFISKFLLPKYEDKYNPEKWRTPGIKAKAAFDFVATSANELSVRVNDEILLAPTYIQEEMKLVNSGWAFGIGNGKSGLIPLNYLVILKRVPGSSVLKNSRNLNNNFETELPIVANKEMKSNIKRVSFGENQIIESNGTERIVKIPETDSDTKKFGDEIKIFSEPTVNVNNQNQFDPVRSEQKTEAVATNES